MLKLIQGTAAIDKAIVSIKNRGGKLDADIQTAGVSVLAHVQEHGDSTIADRLLNAMPKGARKNALVEWMLAYGSMRVLSKADPVEAEAIKAGRVFKYEKARKTDLEGAAEKAWHTFKPEASPIESYDVQAAVQALIKRVQSMQAKGVHIEGASTLEGLAKLVQA